ncbi:MAG: hypothetical protein ACJA2N_000789 [Salibacteraceae bacterium]|jgi:hypothetical protein
MNKSNWYTFLGIILIAVICRLAFESFDIDWSNTWGYLSFLTIVSTYYGMYAQRRNSDEEFDFTMDFKGGAQGGAVFAVGYGIFTYIFYKVIHPYFLEIFVTTRKQEILDQLNKNNQTEEVITAATENFNAFADLIYVPGNLAIITVTSLTFLTLVYALVFAVIAKFFPKFVNK